MFRAICTTYTEVQVLDAKVFVLLSAGLNLWHLKKFVKDQLPVVTQQVLIFAISTVRLQLCLVCHAIRCRQGVGYATER